MTKQKLDFKGSCEFYCKYHKVGEIETAMICGNLGIVVDRLLKPQKEDSDYIKKLDATQNFCITIVQSPQWKAWDKISHLRGWDTAESAECGWLSKEHLQAFLKFVKSEYNE